MNRQYSWAIRRWWAPSALLVLVGCGVRPERAASECRTDFECTSNEICLAGMCRSREDTAASDAGGVASIDTPPAEADDGGTGLLPPVGPPLVGGDDSWRPPASVHLDCPWTSQRLAGCSELHYCAPTSYLMGLACIDHRPLAESQSAELLAAVEVLSSGALPGYPAIDRCGSDMNFNVVAALAARSGFETHVGVAGELEAIYEQLQSHRPVMVAVAVQPENTSDQMTTAGRNHAMLVTGLDAERIYLNDPLPRTTAALRVRKDRPFTISSFLRVWTENGHRAWLSFSGAPSTCTDECPTDRAITCVTASSFRVCGHFDTDPCLEYGTPTPCQAGQSCGASGCLGQICTTGARCDGPDPCRQYEIRCTDGRPSCTAVGFAAAGAVCATGFCDGVGRCACPSGTLWCDGSCVDVGGNPLNCGACGRRCPTDYHCVSARCECVPNCTGRTCGPNGCGGVCGSCAGATVCSSAGTCVTSCTPNCAGRTCGPDPSCGMSCGSCPGDRVCSAAGVCQCAPNCAGRACGADGCGGSCGSCTGSTTCSSSGVCVAVADPRLSYAPSSGAAGTTFTESGTGFSPGGSVDLRWQYPDGHYEPPAGPQRVTASAGGAWTLTWTSPSTALVGTYRATATDLSSGRMTSTTFTMTAAPVTPHISYSPSSGAAGTTFTESGTGFTPNGGVDLRWQYPDGHYEPPAGPQRVTASATGAWTLTWTSPSTALRGTYVATAIDATTRRSTSTSFSVR